MKLLIPMAGLGSRFAKAGYEKPKPLIEFLGKTMIEHVVDAFPLTCQIIFIVQQQHVDEYDVKNFLQQKYEGCDVVIIDGLTEGAACTVLSAKELINDGEPLAIMNSDNIIHFDPMVVEDVVNGNIQGLIMTFEDSNPKWSFAKVGEDGFVTEVVEKKPVSTHATAGLYFWSKGSDFVKAAEQMIDRNLRVNNEFYVAPVYTQNVDLGHKIKIAEADMHGVGTPEDLELYISRYPGASA